LGVSHPDLLDDLLSDRQISDWTAYYQLEPWGEDRADLRMARQIWAILQPQSKKTLDETDFLFEFGPKQRQSAEDRKRKAMRITAGLGGRISTAEKIQT